MAELPTARYFTPTVIGPGELGRVGDWVKEDTAAGLAYLKITGDAVAPSVVTPQAGLQLQFGQGGMILQCDVDIGKGRAIPLPSNAGSIYVLNDSATDKIEVRAVLTRAGIVTRDYYRSFRNGAPVAIGGFFNANVPPFAVSARPVLDFMGLLASVEMRQIDGLASIAASSRWDAADQGREPLLGGTRIVRVVNNLGAVIPTGGVSIVFGVAF